MVSNRTSVGHQKWRHGMSLFERVDCASPDPMSLNQPCRTYSISMDVCASQKCSPYEGWMRSEACVWHDTTMAFPARTAARSADVEFAVNIPPRPWSWTEGLDCVLTVGDYGRKAVSDCSPCARGGVNRRQASRCTYHSAGCGRQPSKLRHVVQIGGGLPDHGSFDRRLQTLAVVAGYSAASSIADVDKGRRPTPSEHPTPGFQ